MPCSDNALGAFSHSAGTAPISTLFIPGTPPQTTPPPPPHRSVHDPFKTASGVQNAGPWDPCPLVVENSRLFAQRTVRPLCPDNALPCPNSMIAITFAVLVQVRVRVQGHGKTNTEAWANNDTCGHCTPHPIFRPAKPMADENFGQRCVWGVLAPSEADLARCPLSLGCCMTEPHQRALRKAMECNGQRVLFCVVRPSVWPLIHGLKGRMGRHATERLGLRPRASASLVPNARLCFSDGGGAEWEGEAPTFGRHPHHLANPHTRGGGGGGGCLALRWDERRAETRACSDSV